MREQFEVWWNATHKYPVAGSSPYEVQGAWDAWEARQAEANALIDDNVSMAKENAALKTEVEQMLEAIKEVDVLIRNNLPVDKTTPAWSMIKKILYK